MNLWMSAKVKWIFLEKKNMNMIQLMWMKRVNKIRLKSQCGKWKTNKRIYLSTDSLEFCRSTHTFTWWNPLAFSADTKTNSAYICTHTYPQWQPNQMFSMIIIQNYLLLGELFSFSAFLLNCRVFVIQPTGLTFSKPLYAAYILKSSRLVGYSNHYLTSYLLTLLLVVVVIFIFFSSSLAPNLYIVFNIRLSYLFYVGCFFFCSATFSIFFMHVKLPQCRKKEKIAHDIKCMRSVDLSLSMSSIA